MPRGPELRTSRYQVLYKLATGGMATVFVAKRLGAAGFSRLVAIKRAHPHLVEQPEFRRMLVAEALLASNLHHTNIVAMLDVEEHSDELLLVMEYVEGVSAAELVRRLRERGETLDPALATRIVLDATAGLSAAHELTDEGGRPLGVVHRDVSPHNILVGVDGTAKLADFGIAKVLHRGLAATTATSVLKGKLGYMAPEYVVDHVLDARSDVFSMGVVLWELLTGRRLFVGRTEVETLKLIANQTPDAPSALRPELHPGFDAVVLQALARSPEERFQNAAALLAALHATCREADAMAPPTALAALVKRLFRDELASRRTRLQQPSLADEGSASTASVKPAREPSTIELGTEAIEPLDETTTHAAGAEAAAEQVAAAGDASVLTQRAVTRAGGGPAPSRRVWIGAVLAGAALLASAALALSLRSRRAIEPAPLGVSAPAPAAVEPDPPVADSAPEASLVEAADAEVVVETPLPPASSPPRPRPRLPPPKPDPCAGLSGYLLDACRDQHAR